MSRHIPPDQTMQRRIITVTNGAFERAKLMAQQKGCTLDDVWEGWGRAGTSEAIDHGLGELYELKEANRDG